VDADKIALGDNDIDLYHFEAVISEHVLPRQKMLRMPASRDNVCFVLGFLPNCHLSLFDPGSLRPIAAGSLMRVCELSDGEEIRTDTHFCSAD
jgi:hypothetical protein